MTNGEIICRLRRLRKYQELSQDYLVEAVNDPCGRDTLPYPPLDRVALSKAENGLIILLPAHVSVIAAFLDCTEHDIYPTLYPGGHS